MKRARPSGFNWSKTQDVDPSPHIRPRGMSRFRYRRLEASPTGRAELRTREKERRQLAEAAAVTRDTKQRLKNAAEGE